MASRDSAETRFDGVHMAACRRGQSLARARGALLVDHHPACEWQPCIIGHFCSLLLVVFAFHPFSFPLVALCAEGLAAPPATRSKSTKPAHNLRRVARPINHYILPCSKRCDASSAVVFSPLPVAPQPAVTYLSSWSTRLAVHFDLRLWMRGVIQPGVMKPALHEGVS